MPMLGGSVADEVVKTALRFLKIVSLTDSCGVCMSLALISREAHN